MQMHTAIEYAINNDFEAVRLPYGNGSFQMTVLLPRIKEGEEPGKLPVVPTLSAWQELNIYMRPREVLLKLPRFETESNMDLVEIMQKLGMTDAFTPTADFSNFCNKPVYIGLMKQVAKINVDEEGSEASAVTVIGMYATAMPGGSNTPTYIYFNANHPFIYVISEKNTGAIFFIGQYTGY